MNPKPRLQQPLTSAQILHFAANAAGIELDSWCDSIGTCGRYGLADGYFLKTDDFTQRMWNSLCKDSDALDLVNRLGLVVRVNLRGEYSLVEYFLGDEEYEYATCHKQCGSISVATRRAITCAAAEIGIYQRNTQ